ncbi:hypothetical protein VTP01DRAFT_6602 [Rhizomucor pusillus]|uniref:uncharacterized protein n=1 Tax=Rhizomucor pusillus TaxID=4840 RepID=UPI003743158D
MFLEVVFTNVTCLSQQLRYRQRSLNESGLKCFVVRMSTQQQDFGAEHNSNMQGNPLISLVSLKKPLSLMSAFNFSSATRKNQFNSKSLPFKPFFSYCTDEPSTCTVKISAQTNNPGN